MQKDPRGARGQHLRVRVASVSTSPTLSGASSIEAAGATVAVGPAIIGAAVAVAVRIASVGIRPHVAQTATGAVGIRAVRLLHTPRMDGDAGMVAATVPRARLGTSMCERGSEAQTPRSPALAAAPTDVRVSTAQCPQQVGASSTQQIVGRRHPLPQHQCSAALPLDPCPIMLKVVGPRFDPPTLKALALWTSPWVLGRAISLMRLVSVSA